MGSFSAVSRRRRDAWALSEPSAVLLWQLGIAWSSVAAIADAATRFVLSGLVLIGPCCVLLTGRWLRTAIAGAWAVFLVVVLGVPDGIWGTRLEMFLIGLAVFVAVSSTLALVITLRTGLSLAATAVFAAACGGSSASSGSRPAASATRQVSCRQGYEAWKHGPAPAAYSRLQAEVKAVRAAEKAGNAVGLKSAMKKLMPAALAVAKAEPIPACADPRDFYGQYLIHAYQGGYNARSAEGLNALVKAAAPLKHLKTIESQLTAEVNRAVS